MSRFLCRARAGLEAYVPGEQPQDKSYIKLNTNESPFSPSETTLYTAQSVRPLNLYPDPEGLALRKKLAGFYGLEPENIAISNGSDELLAFAFLAFCDESSPVVFPDISYGFYSVFAELFRVPYTQIPLKSDLTIDASEYCGIGKNIIIANPNAPTGIELPQESIERILRTNLNNVVIIDEAYVDFGGTSALPLLGKYENLLIVQTFSKSRSLAGGRLGYALGSRELIDDINRVRCSFNPYNVNNLTLRLGEAIIDDNESYAANCRVIAETREYTSKRLREMGFRLTDSKANFVFAAPPSMSGGEYYRRLKERGILVRYFNKPRLEDYVRITVGAKSEMDALLTATNSILRGE